MIPKRQVFVNAVMSIAQAIVLGGIALLLYRYLLEAIGVEQLGIWSLVLATTTVTRIGDLGLSASVVKFAAKYVACAENEKVAGVIQTAALSVGAFIGLFLLIVYPFASWLLSLIVPSAALETALLILPYALASLWVTVITSVFLAGLDGYQRIDLRSVLLMGGAAFHLLLSFMLVPSYGLMGLAYAEVIQAVAVSIGSWFMLRRYLQSLPLIHYRWDRRLFGEMVGYGVNFQVVSIATMLYDPMTKGLLTHFGGFAMVGYYEMASRMILQLRALVISANQVVVPAIAVLQEKKPDHIQVVYQGSYRLLIYLALPLYSIMMACTPIISEVWIGHYEGVFVLFSNLLVIGWFVNTLNAPAYFANLGIGELRWNTASHITIGLLNVGLGLPLGIFYGGTGVVVGWMLSLAVGSNMMSVSYHLRHRIPLRELLPEQNARVALANGVGLLATLILYYRLRHLYSLFAISNFIVLAFVSIVAVPIWLHPMRKRLMEWIAQDLLKVVKAT